MPDQLAPLTVAILLANTLLGERAQGDHPAALRLHSAHLCSPMSRRFEGCAQPSASCSLRGAFQRQLPCQASQAAPRASLGHSLEHSASRAVLAGHVGLDFDLDRSYSYLSIYLTIYLSVYLSTYSTPRRPLGLRLPLRLGVRAHCWLRECQRIHRLARGLHVCMLCAPGSRATARH